MNPSDDPRLAEGITIFNEGRHWHAHEAWESLWLELHGQDKQFLQGLIMVAAMLVQYGRNNPRGVAKHWANVQARLPQHAPVHWRIDLRDLLIQLEPYADASTFGDLKSTAVRIRRR